MKSTATATATATATLALALAVTGCLEARTYMDPAANNGFGGDEWGGSGIRKYGESDPGFSLGALRGDLGPVRGFNDTRAQVTGYADEEFGDSSNVTVTGEVPNGGGFVSLDVYSMNLRTVEAGQYSVSNGDVDMGVVVCSDSSDGSIHFDAMAEEGTITITDIDADRREVTIDTTTPSGDFAGTSTQQTASFQIDR